MVVPRSFSAASRSRESTRRSKPSCHSSPPKSSEPANSTACAVIRSRSKPPIGRASFHSACRLHQAREMCAVVGKLRQGRSDLVEVRRPTNATGNVCHVHGGRGSTSRSPSLSAFATSCRRASGAVACRSVRARFTTPTTRRPRSVLVRATCWATVLPILRPDESSGSRTATRKRPGGRWGSTARPLGSPLEGAHRLERCAKRVAIRAGPRASSCDDPLVRIVRPRPSAVKRKFSAGVPDDRGARQKRERVSARTAQ